MEHGFCRQLLAQTLVDVRQQVNPERVKAAWAFKPSSFSGYEFHGPDEFYWYGQADCLWHAKVKGWQAYLASINAEDVECNEE